MKICMHHYTINISLDRWHEGRFGQTQIHEMRL